MELNDLEYDILNCLYFVEPFKTLVEECREDRNIIADQLKTLIHKKMVVPMRFDEEQQEYVRSYIYDSDNMDDYHYLATKEGLMAHNGR